MLIKSLSNSEQRLSMQTFLCKVQPFKSLHIIQLFFKEPRFISLVIVIELNLLVSFLFKINLCHTCLPQCNEGVWENRIIEFVSNDAICIGPQSYPITYFEILNKTDTRYQTIGDYILTKKHNENN